MKLVQQVLRSSIGLLALVAMVAGAKSGVAVAGSEGSPLEHETLAELQALMESGDYGEVQSLARKALPEIEAKYGETSPSVAQLLDLLIEAQWREGAASDPETRAQAERAVKIRESLSPSETGELAVSLTNLAMVLQGVSDFAGARAPLERAIRIRESLLGPDHLDVGRNLLSLGRCASRMGEFDAAQTHYERALEILEKGLGPNDLEVAQVLNNLAGIVQAMGDGARGKELFERALSIREEAFGPDHRLVAQTLSGMGRLHYDRGEFVEARQYYERGLSALENSLGPDHVDIAWILNYLGNLYMELGDRREARAVFERALAVREAALPPEHPLLAVSLNSLAWVIETEGDYERARSLYERALPIMESVWGVDNPWVSEVVSNLGSVLAKLGEFERAKEMFERSLASREKAFGPEHLYVARALMCLGNVHSLMGEYAEARPLLVKALEIQESLFGSKHPDHAQSAYDLARVLFRLDQNQDAFDAALRAEGTGREYLRLLIQSLSERRALNFASTRPGCLDLALSIVAREPESSRIADAWDSVIRSRAVLFDEMAARNRFARFLDDPAFPTLIERLKSARQNLANVTIRGPGDEEPGRYRDELERAFLEKEDAERTLAERSAVFRRELAKVEIGWQDARGALQDGDGLVAYSRYFVHGAEPAEDPTDQRPSDSSAYVAFVVTGSRGEPRAVPLGSAGEIEALVSDWQARVARPPEPSSERDERITAGEDATRAWRKTGVALRSRVWDPLQEHLKDANRVFLVPDGALHVVSFGALPAGAHEYLVETGPLVHYLSAERDLVVTPRGTAGHGLLALGGADFDADPAFETSPAEPQLLALASPFRGARSKCASFEELRFGPLPGSVAEVAEISSLWENLGRTEERVEDRKGIVRLEGVTATEAAIKFHAEGKSVIHLATHGFFLGGDCSEAPTSARGVGGVAPLREESTRGLEENLLLACGLAVAGANRRAEAGPGEEDGILTAEEIAVVDLAGVDLVVLSACDTGLGVIRSGEGVFGLRRAFRTAGARTVITSLWPVEDEATRQWMGAFYAARLERDVATAEAVREGSLAALESRRVRGVSDHPFYWGGFVASGDWR